MPRSTEEFSQIYESRKNDIIMSALKVFCIKGYESTTINDITKKAKCSHGLFYHYFKTKKQIFEEVIHSKKTANSELVDNKINLAPTYREKLRVFIDGIFDELKHDESFAYYFYLFISQSFLMKEHGKKPPKKNEPKENPFVKLTQIFEQGQKANEFTSKYSPSECTNLFFAITQGVMLNFVISPKDMQKSIHLPSTEFILDIYRKGEN